MGTKKMLAAVGLSTVLLLACGSSSYVARTQVDFADSQVAADAYLNQATEATAVAGFESASASQSTMQLEPAPGPTWELSEGHITLVGFAEQ